MSKNKYNVGDKIWYMPNYRKEIDSGYIKAIKMNGVLLEGDLFVTYEQIVK